MRAERVLPAAIALAVLMLIAPSLLAVEVEEKDLFGTWTHVSSSKTPDGERVPLDEAAISWSFEAGGKGTYHQTVAALKMNTSRPLFWELDGESVKLFNKKGAKKPSAVYTVIENSASAMVWKNNRLGDYYHLEKKE